MKEPTALQRLDALMADLIEADQTGDAIDPLRVAQELGSIRGALVESPAVRPAAGGRRHFRCESCGTISHADTTPSRCPQCGGEKLFSADLVSPDVDAGPA